MQKILFGWALTTSMIIFSSALFLNCNEIKPQKIVKKAQWQQPDYIRTETETYLPDGRIRTTIKYERANKKITFGEYINE